MEDKKVPQRNYFGLVVRLKKINTILIYIIFIISIALIFIDGNYNICDVVIKPYLDIINFVLMILFAGLTFFIDLVLFPNAEKIRRSDFIDNSFGSNFNIHNSEGYFSNDNIDKGIYKAAVNLFENCLFTLNISKKMQLGEVVKSLMFIIVIIVLAVEGFQNSKIAIPVLQLFLSATILGELIKLLLFVNRTEGVFMELQSLFNDTNFKDNPINNLHRFIKVYANYETNISWGMILLNGKLYNKLNPSLSKEWEQIKIKLNLYNGIKH